MQIQGIDFHPLGNSAVQRDLLDTFLPQDVGGIEVVDMLLILKNSRNDVIWQSHQSRFLDPLQNIRRNMT